MRVVAAQVLMGNVVCGIQWTTLLKSILIIRDGPIDSNVWSYFCNFFVQWIEEWYKQISVKEEVESWVINDKNFAN